MRKNKRTIKTMEEIRRENKFGYFGNIGGYYNEKGTALFLREMQYLCGRRINFKGENETSIDGWIIEKWMTRQEEI